MPTDNDVLSPSRRWDELFDDVVGRSSRLRARRRRWQAGITGAALLVAGVGVVPLVDRDAAHRVTTLQPASQTTEPGAGPAATPPKQEPDAKRVTLPSVPLLTTTTRTKPEVKPPPGEPGTSRVAFVTPGSTDGSFAIAWVDPDQPERPRVLVDGAAQPAWSPDGTSVAYVTPSDVHVHVRAFSNGREEGRDHDLGTGADPAWSPDGSTLAFRDALRGGLDAIWIMRADGSERRPVIMNKDGAHSPTWVDAKRLIYVAGRSGPVLSPIGSMGELHLAGVDGSGDRAIGAGADPAVSLDGKRLAYADKRGIVVAPVDAAAAGRPITNGPLDGQPTWSPDGARLAFTRAGRGPSATTAETANDAPSVYVVSPVGGTAALLVTNAADAAWGKVAR